MEDTETDLDFEIDPIKDFLLQKLEEIKSSNSILEREISDRNELLRQCQDQIANTNGGVVVDNVWKRVLYSKYIFGITVTNKASWHCKIGDIILNWNSSNPLTYSTRAYKKYQASNDKILFEYLENQWVNTEIFESTATVLLAVSKPEFLKQTSHNINGIINYELNGNEFQMPLPKLSVSVDDFNDSDLEVKRFKLIQGGEEEFLTYLVASEGVDLVGTVANQIQLKPESLLRIDCMFKELEVMSKEKYFVVDGISASIDGCLIELLRTDSRGLFYFRVLSRDQEQIKQLLHYLYKNIQGLSVLPKTHRLHLFKSSPSFSQSFNNDEVTYTNTEEFREKLLQEINFIEEFHRNNAKGCTRDDYIKFKNDLNELEYSTDALYTESNFSL